MTAPLIHGGRRFISASKLLDVAGEALHAIKRDDGLTWAEVGEAIGKSDDQAGKYATGQATMDFITFFRCCERWNGRFANSVFALSGMTLVDATAADAKNMRLGIIKLTELCAGMQMAMLDDDLSDEEVEGLDALIEAAGSLVDSLRLRLSQIRQKQAEKGY